MEMVISLFSHFCAGNICGHTTGYENYPYLFIWDIESVEANPLNVFQTSVCTKFCPNIDYGGKSESVQCIPTQYILDQFDYNAKTKSYTDPDTKKAVTVNDMCSKVPLMYDT
jgi:hypothetical protein